ncbi:MAG: malate/lactate/ureidoglycolate dehydrogenase [Geminicoccaceae bacterium]
MSNLSAAALKALAVLVVRATGSRPEEAEIVADHLVAANLAGHDSHGIGMLPDYVRLVHEKLLVPNQTLRLIADAGGLLHFDGGRGYGHVMASEAMGHGIERARRQGAAVVALKNASHVGRIGDYTEQCAAAGMVSIHFVNVGDHEPHQAPFACAAPRLGTNPFSAGLPGDGGTEIFLDMATSAIAFGKARVARNKGVPVPEATVIDKEGRPTTDPTALVDNHEGALLAFGLHKGSGLAIMCEMLGAALTGGQTIAPHHPRQGGILNSMLSIIIDPAALGDPAAIKGEVRAVKSYIKASPVAPAFPEVLLPGEPEARARVVRGRDGVPIDAKSLADILAAGESLGVARADLERALAV